MADDGGVGGRGQGKARYLLKSYLSRENTEFNLFSRLMISLLLFFVLTSIWVQCKCPFPFSSSYPALLA